MGSLMSEINKIKRLNEEELKHNLLADNKTWHRTYKDSGYIRIDGFHKQMTEGDVADVFSQFGEIADINLIRDKVTGKSKGFCFLCYEDTRSCRYAVDNMNSYELLGKMLKVDHILDYKPPILLDHTKLDANGDPMQVDYKPTGAEGYGVGVQGVLKSVRERNQMHETRYAEIAKGSRNHTTSNQTIQLGTHLDMDELKKAAGMGKDNDDDLEDFEANVGSLAVSSTIDLSKVSKEKIKELKAQIRAEREAKEQEGKKKKKIATAFGSATGGNMVNLNTAKVGVDTNVSSSKVKVGAGTDAVKMESNKRSKKEVKKAKKKEKKRLKKEKKKQKKEEKKRKLEADGAKKKRKKDSSSDSSSSSSSESSDSSDSD